MPARSPIYEPSILIFSFKSCLKRFCLLLFNRLQFCQYHNLGFHPVPTTPSLRSKAHETQKRYRATMEEWKLKHSIEERNGWLKEGRLVIPPSEALKREILQLLHDTPTTGHPGRDETFTQVSQAYWWPGMRTWIMDYVAGCTVCQQNKNVTHRKCTPLYRIPTPENTLPFQQIA